MNNPARDGITARSMEQAFGRGVRLHVQQPSQARLAAERLATWAGKIALLLVAVPVVLGFAAVLASGGGEGALMALTNR